MYQVLDTVYRKPVGQPMLTRTVAQLFRDALTIGQRATATRFRIIRVDHKRVLKRSQP